MKKIFFLLFCLATTQVSFAQLKEVVYRDGDQIFKGQVAKPSGSTKGVLIIPAWKGIDNEARQAASDLEEQGYIAFIADIYGEGNYPADNQAASKIAGYYKSNPDEYVKRIKLALKMLELQGANPDDIAVIGFCFGGTGAIEVARAQIPVKGIVSIHGGLSKGDRPNGPIGTRVLVLQGAADKSVPESDAAAMREELTAASADWQMIYYGGCGHTWTDPDSPDYNETMAVRAWGHLLQFLKEVL